MPRPARKPATPPKRKAIGKPAPREKGRHRKLLQPTAPFVRGGRLSVPDDEPTVVPDFTEYTDEIPKRLFLQALAQGPPRLGRAIRAAGVCSKTVWNWRYGPQADAKFLTAYDLAYKLAIERAEGEMWRRGIEGYETPVYHQGQLVGTEREYDTTAAIFMLKGAKPETYRERFEHTGAGGGPIAVQLDADKLTDAEIAERIEKLRVSLIEPIKQLAATAVAAEVDKAKAAEEAYAQALAVRGNGKNGHGGNGQG